MIDDLHILNLTILCAKLTLIVNAMRNNFDCIHHLFKVFNLLEMEGLKEHKEGIFHEDFIPSSPTIPNNFMDMVSYEVYIPRTYCCGTNRMTSYGGSEESEDSDLTIKRLLIPYGGSIIVLDVIDTSAGLIPQGPLIAHLAPSSVLDATLEDAVLPEGGRFDIRSLSLLCCYSDSIP